MQLIDGKKISVLLLLIVFLFTNTTCKKISKHPINMYGMWFAPGSICELIIEIKKNGQGSYYSTSGDKGCSGKNKIKGKVRYSNRKLYIGDTGFKFISDPQPSNLSDSVLAPETGATYNIKKYKALATMRLKNNVFNSSQENTFIKYIDY